MLILITNDDGIESPGLHALRQIGVELAGDEGEVWVSAPEQNHSGAGHSLSLNEPVRIRKIEERVYATRGTPTDSVIMGVHHVLKDRRPDLILSGINRGSNLAEDVTYSGTISACFEGTLLGIRSIALSQAYQVSDEGRVVPWETAETLAPDLLRRLIAIGLPQGTFLNVNFPNCAPERVEGTVVTAQGKLVHGLWIDERKDGRGFPYYWLRFGKAEEEVREGTDLHAVRHGRISVTPLKLDLTAHELRDQLTKALA